MIQKGYYAQPTNMGESQHSLIIKQRRLDYEKQIERLMKIGQIEDEERQRLLEQLEDADNDSEEVLGESFEDRQAVNVIHETGTFLENSLLDSVQIRYTL